MQTNAVALSAPQILGITPLNPTPGSAVVITGKGFLGTRSVSFGGFPGTYLVETAARDVGTVRRVAEDVDIIRATVPADGVTGWLVVETALGEGRKWMVMGAVVPPTSTPPTVTSFSPASGPSGTIVTITGSNFGGTTAITFNKVAATSFAVVSATQITATVSVSATTGAIKVTTGSGVATSGTSFTRTYPPRIDLFNPAAGTPGTVVTINGQYFNAVSTVRFNGVVAASIFIDSTGLTATVPAGATTGTISVTNGEGVGTSAAPFTVNATPTISSFTPSSGGVGTVVTINGTNLSGTTNVTFNGTAAAFTVVNATRITATVPAAATSGMIRVTTPTGNVTTATGFSVLLRPYEIKFASAPAWVPVGTCSPAFRAELRDKNRALPFVDANYVFNLTSSLGPIFYSDPACANSVNAMSVAAGAAPPSITFYIKPTTIHSTYVVVYSGGLASANLVVHSNSPSVVTLAFGGSAPAGRGICSPMTITARDGATNPVPVPAPARVELRTHRDGYTRLSGQGHFFSDAACSSLIDFVTIPIGQTTAGFFFRTWASGPYNVAFTL